MFAGLAVIKRTIGLFPEAVAKYSTFTLESLTS